MESNISRDHIAMEAMKVVLEKNIIENRTLWDRIRVSLFDGKQRGYKALIDPNLLAEYAYRYADAMIAEREK